MEYCAASDSYTGKLNSNKYTVYIFLIWIQKIFFSQFIACPEGFGEFFNQRRRWMPSTIANILEILSDYKNVVKANPDISLFFIAYQVQICKIVKPSREDLR